MHRRLSRLISARAEALRRDSSGFQTETTPIFHYHRYGLTFDVFANRIDVQERGGLLGMCAAVLGGGRDARDLREEL